MKNGNLQELIGLVELWGKDKGILDNGTVEAQAKKVAEETAELVLAVGQKNDVEIIDGIGDVFVTIILLSKMYDFSIYDCLYSAYKEIQNRKGSMVNGTFVKQSNVAKLIENIVS